MPTTTSPTITSAQDAAAIRDFTLLQVIHRALLADRAQHPEPKSVGQAGRWITQAAADLEDLRRAKGATTEAQLELLVAIAVAAVRTSSDSVLPTLTPEQLLPLITP